MAEYNKKLLDELRVKLNGGKWSDTWYRRHFRGMIDALSKIEKEKASGKQT
jgi:hypothetical protein|tara:strand:+ start:1280 stop:1432 length:153 start_codon:yes stop_codon:yes gene_type:complete